MDFIRSLLNDESIELDEDYQDLLDQIIEEEQVDETVLDEAAIDRVEARVRAREIALYRYIVGTQNLMLAKKFLDLAEKDKSIPSSLVKGYKPAIEMIDEIVQAGPAYVQLLIALHKRAKRAK
jgi:hypothetical protein